MTADTHTTPFTAEAGALAEHTAALHVLLTRFQVSRDLFSVRELSHLHFLRWLVRTGRLEPATTSRTSMNQRTHRNHRSKR